MPDITLPNTFTDASPADAELASENTYLPKATSDNLEVINGRLTNPNRDGWSLGREDVRRGHFSQSGQVAATANQDYFDDNVTLSDFPSPTYDVGDLEEQALAIPGCSVSFFVPWTMTAVLLNWHLSLITDAGRLIKYSPTAATYAIGSTRLQLFVDGFPVRAIQRRMRDGNTTMAYDPIGDPGVYNNDYSRPDTRAWSGSFLYDSSLGSTIIPPGNTNLINRGWHTASIRIVFPKFEETGDPLPAVPGVGVKQARVKTRRMGYTLIR